MTIEAAVAKMIPPGRMRPTIWRGGVMQIHITRACDKACFGCTQGSNLGGKSYMISPADYERALDSIEGYFGVVGMFGGNPAMHPQFPELCEILKARFPLEQRGIWCNHPRGKAAVMRETFNPEFSNLNVHEDREAYDEFVRDWPESTPVLKGLNVEWPEAKTIRRRHRKEYGRRVGDSRHSPPFVAMQDVVPDEERRWEMISDCDINKYWSAMVAAIPGKGLRAFFCEIAGAQAILHANDPTWPDLGLRAEAGWWKKAMEDFKEQVSFYCHRCGIPLRRYGQLANGGEFEEVSATHAEIHKPKKPGRPVALVTIENVDADPRRLARATDYVENGGLH